VYKRQILGLTIQAALPFRQQAEILPGLMMTMQSSSSAAQIRGALIPPSV